MKQDQPENPLLETSGLPAFSKIKPEHVSPALNEVLDDSREQIPALEKVASAPSWNTFVQPLEDMEDRLSRMWSPVSHLNAVKDSDELRTEYESCLPLLSAYSTELGQNETLYAGFRNLKQANEYSSLDQAQKKIVDNALRDFHLTGVDLPASVKDRFKEIQQRLSTVCNLYERNVLDATQGWHLHITDESKLKGLPPTALEMARTMAQQSDQSGWRFTLDIPSYLAFMTYADDDGLRQKMYEAYVTRASETGPGEGQYDNTDVMLEILALRQEMATLLGFRNYAEVSLETKMAESPAQVMEFLTDLARRVKPVALLELEDLKSFAASELDMLQLQAWDIAYASEKYRQSLYEFSEEEVRPFFPAHTVINGMFDVVSRLYGLEIKPVGDVDVWDPEVLFFEIRDPDDNVRGRFYVDLYVRPHKRGGAWMDALSSRRVLGEEVQVPVAYLTCNFSLPTTDKPALLTHDEVITLFHEFGHGLHHMLTQVDHGGVSGINGVAWDAVELPSQFMENWCWQREALDLISGHYQDGSKLPDDLLDKMRRARNFQSGMQFLRQLEFSLFDMRLHMGFDFETETAQSVLDQVRAEVSVLTPPTYNRFQNSFSHIFAGGYSAGYYSYKWAEVLSADAFSLFEENGIFDRETGQSFMRNVLETGGSIEPLEAFVAFRGRGPNIDALLRHSGLQV